MREEGVAGAWHDWVCANSHQSVCEVTEGWVERERRLPLYDGVFGMGTKHGHGIWIRGDLPWHEVCANPRQGTGNVCGK